MLLTTNARFLQFQQLMECTNSLRNTGLSCWNGNWHGGKVAEEHSLTNIKQTHSADPLIWVVK